MRFTLALVRYKHILPTTWHYYQVDVNINYLYITVHLISKVN